MREIKFRAWDYRTRTLFYSVPPNTIDVPCWNYLFWQKVEADADAYVVMQYTGRKDKNGKEIYSGDILFNEVKNGVVQWSDKYMGWMSSDIHKMDGDGVYEVIGNIYENPDLLLSSEGDIM